VSETNFERRDPTSEEKEYNQIESGKKSERKGSDTGME